MTTANRRLKLKLADVAETYPTFWMKKLGAGTLTPKMLKRYCDQLCSLVPPSCLKEFGYYKGYARDLRVSVSTGSMNQSEANYLYLICLCMAASNGTESFLKWKVTDAECEAIFRRIEDTRAGKETFIAFDEGTFINSSLRELRYKLRQAI